MSPAGGAIGSAGTKVVGGGSTANLLANMAKQQIVVIVIDDLQWGDADSAAFLELLVQSPVSGRLLFVISYREEHGLSNPCLRALRAADAGGNADSCLLRVEPLPEAASRELAWRLLSPGPDRKAHVDRVVAESGGNPYFVAELAQHINTHPNSETGGTSLDDVVWRRVLGSRRRSRVLGFACVAGRPLCVSDISAGSEKATHHQTVVSHCAPPILSCGTDCDRETSRSLSRRIRETVFSRLDATVRTSRFRRLAVALEQSECADVETLATFFEGAEDGEKAGHYFEQAAERARDTLAFERAAEFFQKALHLQPAASDRRRKLLTEIGQALANAGHGVRAADSFLEATDSASADEALELRRRAAAQLGISGHVDKAHALFREVLATIGVRCRAAVTFPSSRRSFGIVGDFQCRPQLPSNSHNTGVGANVAACGHAVECCVEHVHDQYLHGDVVANIGIGCGSGRRRAWTGGPIDGMGGVLPGNLVRRARACRRATSGASRSRRQCR